MAKAWARNPPDWSKIVKEWRKLCVCGHEYASHGAQFRHNTDGSVLVSACLECDCERFRLKSEGEEAVCPEDCIGHWKLGYCIGCSRYPYPVDKYTTGACRCAGCQKGG